MGAETASIRPCRAPLMASSLKDEAGTASQDGTPQEAQEEPAKAVPAKKVPFGLLQI